MAKKKAAKEEVKEAVKAPASELLDPMDQIVAIEKYFREVPGPVGHRELAMAHAGLVKSLDVVVTSLDVVVTWVKTIKNIEADILKMASKK
jgi:hypothetical protein